MRRLVILLGCALTGAVAGMAVAAIVAGSQPDLAELREAGRELTPAGFAGTTSELGASPWVGQPDRVIIEASAPEPYSQFDPAEQLSRAGYSLTLRDRAANGARAAGTRDRIDAAVGYTGDDSDGTTRTNLSIEMSARSVSTWWMGPAGLVIGLVVGGVAIRHGRVPNSSEQISPRD